MNPENQYLLTASKAENKHTCQSEGVAELAIALIFIIEVVSPTGFEPVTH